MFPVSVVPARRGDGDHHLQIVLASRAKRVPRARHLGQKPAVPMSRSRDEIVARARPAASRGLPHHPRTARGVLHEILQLNHPPLRIPAHQTRLRRAVSRRLQLLRANLRLERGDEIRLFRRQTRRTHRRDERFTLRRVNARLGMFNTRTGAWCVAPRWLGLLPSTVTPSPSIFSAPSPPARPAPRGGALSCALLRMMVISFCVGQWKLRSAARSGETLGRTWTMKSWYTVNV